MENEKLLDDSDLPTLKKIVNVVTGRRVGVFSYECRLDLCWLAENSDDLGLGNAIEEKWQKRKRKEAKKSYGKGGKFNLAFALVFCYALVAFLLMNVNPVDWSASHRAMYVIAVCALWFLLDRSDTNYPSNSKE